MIILEVSGRNDRHRQDFGTAGLTAAVGAPPETRVITQIESNKDLTNASEGLQRRGSNVELTVSDG